MGKRGPTSSFAPMLLLWFEQDFHDWLRQLRDGRPKRRVGTGLYQPVKVQAKILKPLSLCELGTATGRWYDKTRETELPLEWEELHTWKRRLPGRPELWEGMKRVQTKNQAQALASSLESCRLSWGGCRLPRLMREHPQALTKANVHPLYPRRNDNKRIDFYARWFAGVAVGIPGQRAVEYLRKLKHSRRCECWRCERRRWRWERKKLSALLRNAAAR